MQQKDYYEHFYLNDILPDDIRRRYLYMGSLVNTGLLYPVMVLTYSSDNNLGNFYFTLRVLVIDTVEQCFQKSLTVFEKVKHNIPKYHTRAMRQAMVEKCGNTRVKPAVLYFCKELTGDCSASNTFQESKIDECVCQLIDMEPEDPNTIVDLCEVKKKEIQTKFDAFWEQANKFINEEIRAVVDDRRHDAITHLAKAISIWEL